MKLLMAAGAVFGVIAQGAAAQPAPAAKPVEVMVLGTWHFDNPGQDLNNVKADDVLKPRRQAELEALATAIAAYKPTKIMVERVARTPDLVDPQFSSFTPDKLRQERDERYQVGYRLAHRLKLGQVYAIDEQRGPGDPDYFPFGKVVAFAKANKAEGQLKALMARGAAETKAFEEKQERLGIPALLVDYNDSRRFQSSIGGYYQALRFANNEDQPGADLNAMWYLRNAKIFSKLATVAEPGDRVLVIFGAGHNYWLRHFASETPGFRNVDPIPYLRKAAGK